jgi:predicted O-methyltransferase YrrM
MISFVPPPIDLESVFDDDDLVQFGLPRQEIEAQIYSWYGAYGAALKPRSIPEIGVRRGYGGFALATGALRSGGSVARYVGIDFEMDIVGSNAQALSTLRAAGVSDVRLIRADTQSNFPVITEKFDLIHVDGDHSMCGAIADICNVLPLLADNATLIIDDVETPSVSAACEFLRRAVASCAHLRIGGQKHRQALFTFFADAPQVNPRSLREDMGWLWQQSEFERVAREMRDLLRSNPSEECIAVQFDVLTRAFARRFELDFECPDEAALPLLQNASDCFMRFSEVLNMTSIQARSLGGLAYPWEAEGALHGGYAMQRLRDITRCAPWLAGEPLPTAFARGQPQFVRMLAEVCCNFAAILERAAYVLASLTPARLFRDSPLFSFSHNETK